MFLGDVLRMEGDIAGAIREQGKLPEQDPGNIYAAQKLARAYIDANGDDRDAWFRRDPLLVSIRDHPRFQTIIDSIGFRRSSTRPRGM